MTLAYMTVVLTVVLLRSELSYQQEYRNICEEAYSGCVSFKVKNDNEASFKQCLKACSAQKVPGAKSVEAYNCIDSKESCTMQTYYDIFSQDKFLDYTDCLQACYVLTNDDGKVSDQVNVCASEKEDCFPFATKGSVDGFTNCYLDCQAVWKANHTRRHSRYICVPNQPECVSTTFYTLPEEAEPHVVLKKCYENCGVGGDGGSVTTSKTELFRCDEDSQTCVPCTMDETDCEEESDCVAECEA